MGPFSQAFDGIRKGKVFFLHNELEDIAVSMAAKAIKESFVGSDAEGGGLFIMERAAGPEVAAPPFQRHIIGDDADDVIGLPDLFDKFAGKPFTYITCFISITLTYILFSIHQKFFFREHF